MTRRLFQLKSNPAKGCLCFYSVSFPRPCSDRSAINYSTCLAEETNLKLGIRTLLVNQRYQSEKKLWTNEINHFIMINMNIFLLFVLERKLFLFVLYLSFLFLLSFTVYLPNVPCQNLLLFLTKCRGSRAMQCFSPKMQHFVSSKQNQHIVMQNFFFLHYWAKHIHRSIQLFTRLPK